MLGRLKSFLGGPSLPKDASSATHGNGAHRVVVGESITRQSNGLDQFFNAVRDRNNLNLIDFAGASQENVSYITSMGHRLASEDLVRAIEHTFGSGNSIDAQGDPRLVDQFVQENLDFSPDTFDGALMWDALQFLSPHLLHLTVERLYDTLRPDSYLLAFFYADERTREVPLYHYRIADHRTLSLSPRGVTRLPQIFNNRAIEKLFHRFASVKFFLARDSLREIIVRR